MSILYITIEPSELNYVRISGRTTLYDLSVFLSNYANDRAFHPGRRQLIDLRDLEDAAIAMSEMVSFKELCVQSSADCMTTTPITIVTANAFGERLSWMLSKVMRGTQAFGVKVFREMHCAFKHLGIPDGGFEEHLAQAAGFVPTSTANPMQVRRIVHVGAAQQRLVLLTQP